MSIFSFLKNVIASADDSIQDIKRSISIYFKEPDLKSNAYIGLAENLLLGHKIRPGEKAMYESGIDVCACIIGENGCSIETRVFGERVGVNTFQVISNPTIKFDEIDRRSYNIVRESIERGYEEINAVIDTSVISCIDTAARNENIPFQFGKILQKNDLIELKKEVEKQPRIKADKFLINSQQWNDMIDWRALRIYDEKTQETGLYGRLWDSMNVFVSDFVPQGTVYCLADKKTLGRMPHLGKIKKYRSNDIKALKYGWVLIKTIGIGVLNTKAISIGQLNVETAQKLIPAPAPVSVSE